MPESAILALTWAGTVIHGNEDTRQFARVTEELSPGSKEPSRSAGLWKGMESMEF
jgi:hypothetical protein